MTQSAQSLCNAAAAYGEGASVPSGELSGGVEASVAAGGNVSGVVPGLRFEMSLDRKVVLAAYVCQPDR